MKNTTRIEKLAAGLPSHPVLQANLEKLQDRLNDFVSQFEMGVPGHSHKASNEPRITFTAVYEPEGLHELASDIIKEKTTTDAYVKDLSLGLPVDLRIKGPRSEECAELLTDAFHYSDIEYSQKIRRERDGSYSLGCRPHTDIFQQQMDLLHDFAQANFDNRDLLTAMHETEQKLKAMAKSRPSAKIESEISKTYTRDAAYRPVLHMHYPTTDKALIAAARKLGPEITVRKIRIAEHDASLINGRFRNASGQEGKCRAILDEILSAAEHAPEAATWQQQRASSATTKIVARGQNNR